MKYDHISDQKIDLPWIRNFYRESEDSLNKRKVVIHDAIKTGSAISGEFTGMTSNEVDKRFVDYIDELECLVSFDLISIVEAFIRIDYKERARKGKRKDIINKEFHELYSRQKNDVSLARDLLELWKKHRPETKSIVGQFNGVLNLRHWIAHGRSRKLNLSARHTPENVYDICEKLLDKISVAE